VTYQFEFRHEEMPVAEGTITAVCCEVDGGQRPRPIEIPRHFVDALAPYLATTATYRRGKRHHQK
jgi:4-hydroxybenzoyl-CoA thioesterase/acyl-CoA thioester hydrolase